MSRQLIASANRLTRGQNELTLPPIVEAQISGNSLKKSNSTNRVDSGIAVDYPNENTGGGGGGGGGGWTLSPNQSENGADNRGNDIVTTFEFIEGNGLLKKNATSSTLNSYGKSSSKLTAATNISITSSKFSQSYNGKQTGNNNQSSNNVSNVTTKIIPLSVLASEANYLASIERLNCMIAEPDHSQANNTANTHHNNTNNHNSHNNNSHNNNNHNNNNNSFKASTSNVNNNENLHQQQQQQQRVVSSKKEVQHQNKPEYITSTSNLETTSTYNANKPYLSLKNARAKDLYERQIGSSLRRADMAIQRQNTMTTINHDSNLPAVSRRNSNSTLGNSNLNAIHFQRPVPKPRKIESSTRRSLSLQRQNTSIALTHFNANESNALGMQQNQEALKSSLNLSMKRADAGGLQLHKQMTNITLKTSQSNLTNKNRPKTTAQVNNNNNNNNNNKSVIKVGVAAAVAAPVAAKPAETNLNESMSSTADLEQAPDEAKKNSLDTILAFELPDTTESAISEYTMLRIVKWLEDVENCNSMLQPPSQLAWRDTNVSGSARTQNEFSRNFNNEYCLSDYDSVDEQIIEYNRVVDKTFHIIHDEDS